MLLAPRRTARAYGVRFENRLSRHKRDYRNETHTHTPEPITMSHGTNTFEHTPFRQEAPLCRFIALKQQQQQHEPTQQQQHKQ